MSLILNTPKIVSIVNLLFAEVILSFSSHTVHIQYQGESVRQGGDQAEHRVPGGTPPPDLLCLPPGQPHCPQPQDCQG